MTSTRKPVTHDDLVDAGRRWLVRQSPVVITELVSGSETPDVIGFGVTLKDGRQRVGYGSVLLECKTSRADFRADQKKVYRRLSEQGLGEFRLYVTPQGLLKVEELPAGWGLLEVQPRGGLKMVCRPKKCETDRRSEVALLVSCLRRVKLDASHVSIRTYVHETKNRASITLNPAHK